MPIFMVDPQPEMSDQRLAPGTLPNFCIDPTCGRYCLKALLKYHFRKCTNVRVHEIKLPKSTSFLGDVIGYDPFDDFPYADQLLKEKYGALPGTLGGWIDKLQKHGPIILCGKGLGHASDSIGHYVLLVGGNTTTQDPLMYYMDPLRGDEVFRESYATMAPKISGMVYARSDICQNLHQIAPLPGQVADLAF